MLFVLKVPANTYKTKFIDCLKSTFVIVKIHYKFDFSYPEKTYNYKPTSLE